MCSDYREVERIQLRTCYEGVFLVNAWIHGFALNHDKSLQINFICVKHRAKNDFQKDVESTVAYCPFDIF